MKEMNENQLISWRPRQPSAGLKRRVLRLASDVDVPTARWLWSCVAPTMACALLALMAFNRDANDLESKLPMTSVLSNQDNAAFASGTGQTEQNRLATVTFGWTNASVLRSSIHFTTTNLTN